MKHISYNELKVGQLLIQSHPTNESRETRIYTVISKLKGGFELYCWTYDHVTYILPHGEYWLKECICVE